MDDGALFTIGEMAERTGLTVKAIRFYSDQGIVPATTHSPGGYRLYESPRRFRRLHLLRKDEVCEFEEVPAGVA
ncbi:MerR family DNA-binding transcriptional regulator [Nocardia cyriacigeorgica]|uniref:MerR family DNA-binding transcriptional regulator n=1 Tax=Nocardia cyriacigeorgica TaxID=135487 RepID=UPI003515243D